MMEQISTDSLCCENQPPWSLFLFCFCHRVVHQKNFRDCLSMRWSFWLVSWSWTFLCLELFPWRWPWTIGADRLLVLLFSMALNCPMLLLLLLIMMVLLKRQRVEEQQPKTFGTPRADQHQWHEHWDMFCCWNAFDCGRQCRHCSWCRRMLMEQVMPFCLLVRCDLGWLKMSSSNSFPWNWFGWPIVAAMLGEMAPKPAKQSQVRSVRSTWSQLQNQRNFWLIKAS